MLLVPFRCCRFTAPTTNQELIIALEQRIPAGVVRLNECSQEFLWVQQQAVTLLLVRQDEYFAWLPLAAASVTYSPKQSWWKPMRLQVLMPLHRL